ncbi:hypothetical protein BKK80_13545 [Cupriavidus malaysiensis]|uniref:Uncharacterized protein n=1 Tax=Cupriavidus malaysiensis TaxID=367825 RepID=A0A1D9I3Q2_9BURK|nr:hypothetical protein BKK80_13545 [Cupriavidus malaysiensis]
MQYKVEGSRVIVGEKVYVFATSTQARSFTSCLDNGGSTDSCALEVKPLRVERLRSPSASIDLDM